MIRTLTAIIIASGLAIAPAFAAAEKFDIEVSFDRADFATPEAAAAEYDRIASEINNLCRRDATAEGSRRAIEISKCRREMMQKVVIAIGDPNLTAVHNAAKH